MIAKLAKFKFLLFTLLITSFGSGYAFGGDVPSQFLDPSVFATNLSQKDYLLSWIVSYTDPVTRQSKIASNGTAEISGAMKRQKVGEFDWLLELDKNNPVNTITVLLAEKNGDHSFSVAKSINEKLFTGKNKELDEKLNLFVLIDKNQRLVISVSDKNILN